MTHYTTGEFAKKIGVCNRTLVRWDKAGVLVAHRTPMNRRYYTEEQLQKYYVENWDTLNYHIMLGVKCPIHLVLKKPDGSYVFWRTIFNGKGYDIEVSGIEHPTQKATITVWHNWFNDNRTVVEILPNIPHEDLPRVWQDVEKSYKGKRGNMNE